MISAAMKNDVFLSSDLEARSTWGQEARREEDIELMIRSSFIKRMLMTWTFSLERDRRESVSRKLRPKLRYHPLHYEFLSGCYTCLLVLYP